MRPTKWTALLAAFVLVLALGVAACGESDEPEENAGGTTTEQTEEGGGEGGAVSEWFVQEDFDQSQEWREATPEGPEGEPWAQMLPPAEMVDTAEYKADGPANICFSNASVDNPWRQVGWKVMQATVESYGDEIGKFRAVDAEAQDEKQISDIERLSGSGDCDVLIVSPNTTKTLTPAVEQACEEVPVVVFDRGVDTDCPVSFVQPIGGYAFGAEGAEFLSENVDPGGKILALRILPGVDVLETRYAAMREIFDEGELELVGAEFTDGDPAKTKSIVSDYIQREGQLDGHPADRRRGPVRLPRADAGGRRHRHRADLPHLPVADRHRRGRQDRQGRGGPEEVDPPAGAGHGGERRRHPPGGPAAAALRAVRLRGPARLAGALGRLIA
jgi:ribose transport system substrate-binding protein